MSNLFEKAARLRLRFDTAIGLLTIEDLWRLPLKDCGPDKVNLNEIAKTISRKIKDLGDEDFVDGPNEQLEVLELSLDILKYIIKVRLEENKAKDDKILREQRNRKIAAIIEQKKDEELGEKSFEELQELIAKDHAE